MKSFNTKKHLFLFSTIFAMGFQANAMLAETEKTELKAFGQNLLTESNIKLKSKKSIEFIVRFSEEIEKIINSSEEDSGDEQDQILIGRKVLIAANDLFKELNLSTRQKNIG